MITIYKCFHDHGSIPTIIDSIRKPILCGADIKWRNTGSIMHIFRDNVGENISKENEQYSELTGYYWIWKNDKDSDIIGIEHYRRHFIKKANNERGWDPIQFDDIIKSLISSDIILPNNNFLVNTSIYDLYVICFHDIADEMIKYIGKYFKLNNKEKLLNSFLYYMSHNELTNTNMLITSKIIFNEYCKELFSLIDYLKINMDHRNHARIWGYVSEIFPMIFAMAYGLKVSKCFIAVDDYDMEKCIAYTTTTFDNEPLEFNINPDDQIKKFKELIES